MKSVWTIAGHDPLGAAGIQADLRAAEGMGVPLRSIIATFTAQNNQRLGFAAAVPESWLRSQWELLKEEETPGAIKLGYMPHADTLRQVGSLLQELSDVPVIADPVLGPSAIDGTTHLSAEWRNAFREFIVPHLTLLTPNLPESEWLLGRTLQGEADSVSAAAELRSWGVPAVLIKGGHGDGEELFDFFDDGSRSFYLRASKQRGRFRGTGCALSSAIAAGLARGENLREATVTAHAYLQGAIAEASAKTCSILSFERAVQQLSPLSYRSAAFDLQPFAAASPERLRFYPVVPNLLWLKRLLSSGIKSIQLRIKDQDRNSLYRDIAEAIALCRAAAVDLYINDYWDIALELGAFGVHLGQEDLDCLSSADLNRLQAHKQQLRLGLSTHSLEEAARALALAPSYIALGPIFPTSCKSMNFGPQGINRIADWRKYCGSTPLVAIGGLKLEHARAVRAAGADGVALVSDVIQNAEPESRIQAWLLSLS